MANDYLNTRVAIDSLSSVVAAYKSWVAYAGVENAGKLLIDPNAGQITFTLGGKSDTVDDEWATEFFTSKIRGVA